MPDICSRTVRELFIDAFTPDQLDTVASIAAVLAAHLHSLAGRA